MGAVSIISWMPEGQHMDGKFRRRTVHQTMRGVWEYRARGPSTPKMDNDMRHQEHQCFRLIKIHNLSIDHHSFREKQVMSCVQAFTAALGFLMSAGWDWLPSMQIVASRNPSRRSVCRRRFGFRHAVGSIFFKMIMLLALCPIVDVSFWRSPLDQWPQPFSQHRLWVGPSGKTAHLFNCPSSSLNSAPSFCC